MPTLSDDLSNISSIASDLTGLELLGAAPDMVDSLPSHCKTMLSLQFVSVLGTKIRIIAS